MKIFIFLYLWAPEVTHLLIKAVEVEWAVKKLIKNIYYSFKNNNIAHTFPISTPKRFLLTLFANRVYAMSILTH